MTTIRHKNPPNVLVLICGLTLLTTSYFDVRISLFLLIAAYFAFLANSQPWIPLALFIIITPLSNIYFLDFRIAGIPGLDLANSFLLCALVVYLLSRKNLKLAQPDMLIISVIVFIQVIAFLRSIPYLYFINAYQGTNMTVEKYTISHLFKPLSYLFPLIIIAGYFRGKEQIILLNKIILFSAYLMSVVIVLTYIFKVSDKGNWELARNAIGDFFGIHSNDIAIFYITSYPLILVNFIRKKSFYTISCLSINLVAIGLLYSRTAYILVVFCTIIFFLMEKNKKWLVGSCAILILILSFSGETVKQRFMSGLEEGDISTISAGRINQIWPAAVEAIQQDITSLMLGTGRYSIIHAGNVQKGHPHNMYLETILDSGILGLFGFLAVFIAVMRKFLQSIPLTNDREMKLILKACFVSLLVYLISGISGRHFFPHLTNSYLWIVMALGLTVTKMSGIRRSAERKTPPAHTILTAR